MPREEIVDLQTLEGGAVMERFNLALQEVLKNINDPNTEPMKARSITLKFTIKPDENREVCTVSISSDVSKTKGENMESLLSDLAAKWPSAWVTRCEARKFTGGMIGEKYLANLDSAGQGPAGRIRCGRRVAYPVNEFIKWLEKRSAVIPERKK